MKSPQSELIENFDEKPKLQGLPPELAEAAVSFLKQVGLSKSRDVQEPERNKFYMDYSDRNDFCGTDRI